MKRPLKIAYFLDNFYPQINGVVTSSINTIFEMSRRGHEVNCIASSLKKKLDYTEDFFPFHLYNQKGFKAFFYPDFTFTYPFSEKIFRIIKNFDPDIFHFHAPFTIGYQALNIAKKLNKPVVGTFHTFFAEPEYLSIVGMKHSIILQKIGWWYSNQFFNRCDTVISPGLATANFLLEKELNNNLVVISNGVNKNKYLNFKFTEKFQVEIKDDEDWLLFIGRISEEKCIPVLLDSFKIIFRKNPRARLLIIGDGPSRKKYINMTTKNNLNRVVVFTGSIPNNDLLESGILKKMKLFVTPSTSENQPMTIIEAITFGLPIVGVNAKGIPELIEGNGFIVPPGDPEIMANKILEILDNKELHRKFSEKSLELSEKYNIKNTTDKMEELYYKVIEDHKNK
jgi:1,2-diacylglycerol 3-alpha-glucosyltransferase